MIISDIEEGGVRDLMIGGVIHRIEFTTPTIDDKTPVFMHMMGGGSAFLDQDDIDILADFFGSLRS